MARSLMAVGVAPDRAYALARRVGDELASAASDVVELDRLEALAVEVLGEAEGREAIRRLRRYQELRELDLPIIVLIGGATGTGKSTVATEIAYRLGITRVTSTDFVRQTMRAFFSHDVHAGDPLLELRGGRRRCRTPTTRSSPASSSSRGNVLVGVRASSSARSQEGWSLVLEGVHLVPGLRRAAAARERARRCFVVLSIEDEDEHAQHFRIRDEDSERPDVEVPRALRRHPPACRSYIVGARGARGRAGDRERERGPRGADGRRARPLRRRASRDACDAMSESAEYEPEQEQPCQCQAYLRATEHAALASARWLGRADEEAAEEAAATGMRATLDILPISGRVVFGALDDSGGLDAGRDRRLRAARRSTSRSTRSRAAASSRAAATARCR